MKYHSCWDLLHHTVFWQDIILKNLEGEYIDWNTINNEDNWPSDEFLSQECPISTYLSIDVDDDGVIDFDIYLHFCESIHV